MIEMQDIVYYEDGKFRPLVDTRPLNVVFLTSVRDIGTCDRNGTLVATDIGFRYMEGVIERTIREAYPELHSTSGLIYRGSLVDRVRVVGVITDDTDKDIRRSSYSALPKPGYDWIYPFELSTPEGQLLREMTYNIPSSFRLLPLNALEERRQLKYEFEWAVLQKVRELDGDVIVSDHYMAKIDYLWGELGFYGRVLNIHPAITVKNSPFCFRGKTPTADAIERARSGIPTQTGATLHFIDEEIDAGPPVAYIAGTPVFPTDEAQWLRYRNYTAAKLPLFVNGIAHYARAIYPFLDQINLSSLQPFEGRYSLYDLVDINSLFQQQMLERQQICMTD